MKKQLMLALFTVSILLSAINSYAGGRDIYQLKIYSIESEAQEQVLDNYLEKAYIPALHRAGIKHVGVFKPRETVETTGNFIMVLVPFSNIEQFEKLEGKLKKDKKYLSAGSDYINAAHDDAPYTRIESIILRAFKSMPEYGVPGHTTSHSDRVYELRSYQGATEERYEKKVEMFDSGEAQLFLDLDFQPILFGEVISGPDMPNLMYLTTFENKEAQDKHWDAFRKSPVWEKMKSDPQYKNTVSNIDKFLLYPTAYSDL